MGWRFRKSFKIAPGIKLNLNKKSTSVTFGTRGAHYTINSKGKRTKSFGFPGTGISYVETSGGNVSTSTSPTPNTSYTDSNLPENGDKKNKGCLLYLIYFLLLLVAIVFAPVLWIPGIFVTAFFAIKKEPDKKKKLRRILISGIITIISFCLLLIWPSSPDLKTLNVNLEKQEFEITDKVSLDVEGTPEDADITSLDISNNDIASVKYDDGKAILSFKKEGTANIYFIANDSIKSKKETITVIDPVAEAKREQAKKEAEEKKKAEEEARIKAEQEAKQKAEEEARIKAEQEAQQKAQEEARIKAEQEAEAQRQAELAAQQQAQASSQQQVQTGGTVYWVASGEVYHSTPNCPSLSRSKKIYSGTIAESGKSRPCKVCY